MEKNIYKIGKELFITSDEKIKEGGWHFNLALNLVEKTTSFHNGLLCEKIILTTDQDLIKDGVQAIDDTFLEWFVKNPSCESVEVENHYRVKSGTIQEHKDGIAGYEYYEYKIIIPQEELKTSEEWQKQFPNPKVLDPDGWDRKNYQYSWFEEKITLAEYTTRLHKSSVQGLIPQEEPKQEKLEEYIKEVTKNFGDGMSVKFTSGGIKLGAKWQAKRMYSEEEVGELVYKIMGEYANKKNIFFKGDLINNLFEQFKKK